MSKVATVGMWLILKNGTKNMVADNSTRSAAVAEGLRVASCHLKPCKVSSNCICKDLQQPNDLQDYSGSLEMARIDRPYDIFC